MRPLIKKFAISLLPGFLGAAISFGFGLNPNITEQYYSKGIFPFIALILGKVFGSIPFSVAQCILFGLPAAFVIFILYYFIGMNREKRKQQSFTKNTVFYILFAAGCVYFLFSLLCAPNYHRLSFADYAGLKTENSSTEELAGLCSDLIREANSLRTGVDTDGRGVMRLADGSMSGTMREARMAFDRLEIQYPILSVSCTVPKAFYGSELMSYLNLGGFYFPYTGEANINVDMPDQEIPFASCHELAHTAGFMREDEANFISYLACIDSDHEDIRYSGVLQALIYSTNALYSSDRALYDKTVAATPISQGVIDDLHASSEYWKKYEGKAAEVSEKVNDTYLKLNSQTDGTQSYGRLVDLLLAKRRKDIASS